MSITARMRCNQVNAQQSEDGQTIYSKSVTLNPVYSSDPESPNFSFSQATPSGLLQLHITNPGAFNQFDEGDEYDIMIVKRTIGNAPLIAPDSTAQPTNTGNDDSNEPLPASA